ncbi:MAG TPA: FAD-dependent oxidoreductase [Opitutaceae bacterium]|nr:FAD-dependent oxidoreductase [Opitutaceae bacterium]
MDPSVPPSARPEPSRIAVFGAGIAGLTVAHELARRGHRVAVYEAEAVPGGFFRSERRPEHAGMPSEYSWHGMGPWYHNVFDLLRQIPYDARGTVYDRALSRPIDFGVFPDDAPARFYDRGLASIPGMFRLRGAQWLPWAWLMLKTWTADRRSREHYARLNAAEAWGRRLDPVAARTWRACFGPWVGSDWTRCSLHTAGSFFRKQLMTRPAHFHAPDEDGPAWWHQAGDGWLLLRGPSSEVWFDRWVRALGAAGVEFRWSAPLERIDVGGEHVTGAEVGGGERVVADWYVLAVTPFAAARILARTPELERRSELARFRPLIQDGPHVQVSFRVAFGEPVAFPRARTAVVLADSEFNLTVFAQEQAWRPEVFLGEGVKSLWTGTSCASTRPGRLYGIPVEKCTREQFVAEIRAQIMGCGALDALVREANGGRGLADFGLERIEIWHEWEFSPGGIRHRQPKWVTTTRTQPHQPGQVSGVPNLLLAGAHTRTAADVWSIEAAVESGRRAARAIDPRVRVVPQHRPAVLRVFGAVDDACFRLGLPHVLDLLAGAALGAAVGGIAWAILGL